MKVDLSAQTFLMFLVSPSSIPGRLHAASPNSLFHNNYFPLARPQLYHIADHHPVVVPKLLLRFFLVRCWFFFLFCFFFYTVFLSCCPYTIFSIILLYNKEVISRTLSSLSTSASCAAVTGPDPVLYNFEIVYSKMNSSFYFNTFLRNFYGQYADHFKLVILQM